jgi:hypothetical protein
MTMSNILIHAKCFIEEFIISAIYIEFATVALLIHRGGAWLHTASFKALTDVGEAGDCLAQDDEQKVTKQ